MNKVAYLACLSGLIALSACSGNGSSSAPASSSGSEQSDSATSSSPASSSYVSPFEQSLNNLRTGFTITGSRYQIVKSLEGTELFRNTYTYDYSFENSSNSVGTHQKYGYMYNGQPYSLDLTVYRDEDGYVASKYIDYKNQVAYSRTVDSEGYYSLYDELFINPFLIVEEADFTKLDEGNSYSLASNKLAVFDYYLTGGSYPLTEMIFTFDDNSVLTSISSKSIVYEGTTRDSSTNRYINITYTYEATFQVSKIGQPLTSNVTASTGAEVAALKDAFASLGDNFTLTTVCKETSTGTVLLDEKKSYFDGNSYYIEWDAEDMSQNRYYAHDPFNKNEYFYEYAYDESTRLWKKTANDSESSFNIDPKTSDYFIPHLKDVSTNLFKSSVNTEGYYVVDNQYAMAYMGQGMLSDAEILSYFVLGYGTNLEVKLNEDSIEIVISFLLPVSSSQYYSLEYLVTYSDIGTTVVEEKDI